MANGNATAAKKTPRPKNQPPQGGANLNTLIDNGAGADAGAGGLLGGLVNFFTESIERSIDPRGRFNPIGALLPPVGEAWREQREARTDYLSSVADLQTWRLEELRASKAQEAADEATAERIYAMPGAAELLGGKDAVAVLRELGGDGLSVVRAAIEGDIEAQDEIRKARRKARIDIRKRKSLNVLGLEQAEAEEVIQTEGHEERKEGDYRRRGRERRTIAAEKASLAAKEDKIDRAAVEDAIGLLPEKMWESVLALPPDEALEVLVDAAKTKGDDRHARLTSRLSARREREKQTARDEAALLRFEQRRSERRAGQRFRKETTKGSQEFRATQADLARNHREYMADIREGYTAARIKQKGLTTKAAKQAKRAEMMAAVEAGIELIPPHLRKAVRAMPPEMAVKRITIAADAIRAELHKADIPKPPPTWTNVAAAIRGLHAAITDAWPDRGLEAGVTPPEMTRISNTVVTDTLARNFDDPQVSMAYARDRALILRDGPRFALPSVEKGRFARLVGGKAKNRDAIAAALTQRTLDHAILDNAGIEGALAPRSPEFINEVVTALRAIGVEAEAAKGGGVLIPGSEELQDMINNALNADVGGSMPEDDRPRRRRRR